MVHKKSTKLNQYFVTVQKTDSHETHVVEVYSDNEYNAVRAVYPHPDYKIVHVEKGRGVGTSRKASADKGRRG
jgi:hypothetical protein